MLFLEYLKIYFKVYDVEKLSAYECGLVVIITFL